jgi:hypothetical protein
LQAPFAFRARFRASPYRAQISFKRQSKVLRLTNSTGTRKPSITGRAAQAKAGAPDDIPDRGYQLVQPIGNPNTPSEFDSNVTRADAFGSGVMWLTSSNAGAIA